MKYLSMLFCVSVFFTAPSAHSVHRDNLIPSRSVITPHVPSPDNVPPVYSPVKPLLPPEQRLVRGLKEHARIREQLNDVKLELEHRIHGNPTAAYQASEAANQWHQAGTNREALRSKPIQMSEALGKQLRSVTDIKADLVRLEGELKSLDSQITTLKNLISAKGNVKITAKPQVLVKSSSSGWRHLARWGGFFSIGTLAVSSADDVKAMVTSRQTKIERTLGSESPENSAEANAEKSE